MTLANKTALVTGASRGIGRAILLELGRQGAQVVGTATTPEGAKKINEAISSEGYTGAGVVMDVTNQQSINDALSKIREDNLTPTILVNNAGITRDNLIMRMKDEDWQSIIDTNLTSVFKLSRACIKDMMKAKWGRIINVGSVVGTTGNPGQTNYSASKAGLLGFSKSLAREVGSRGITVNVLAPGFIDTDMTRQLPDKQQEMLLTQIPTGRLGHPEEVAAVAAFLASPSASYVTGETIHVNGGMFMG